MKKILSILLLIACIFCVMSCGEEEVTPATADNFKQISGILEERATTYRLCDEEEITETEEFFTGSSNDYTDAIGYMCYAQMADKKYVKCMYMYYEIDARVFVTSYGHNFDYVVRKGNIVLYGTSPIIEEFAAE